MIPTQFGNVPDVAFEEIKQFRAQQQQQQTGSIHAPTSSFAPTNPSNITSDTNSNQIRPSARDLSLNPANGLVRSRSLAANTGTRPSVAAASTYLSNPSHQTPIFGTNKHSFMTPNRYGVGRLFTNNNSHPPAPSSSSTSFATNRSLPVNTSLNIKSRHTNNYSRHHPPSVTVNTAAVTATGTNNDQHRSHYETTYRASFIKPLAP